MLIKEANEREAAEVVAEAAAAAREVAGASSDRLLRKLLLQK